jgi:pimeloyl-ACP methyl ester carboxylesterase
MPAITLGDGRRLAYQVLGDPDGRPVLVLHGTPGSWRHLAVLGAPARERGIRVIAPDRPGYGGSSHDRTRTMASAARDLGALIRDQNLDGCIVVGVSGGGPTALACGAKLDGMVQAVVTVGGVAPLVPRDPSLPPDRLMTRIARRSEKAAQAIFEVMVRFGRARPEAVLTRSESIVAEPDARLLRDDADVRRAFIDDLRNASPTTAGAAARDFRLFALPWDIDLASVKVPVHVWHGTLDRNVPVAHARVIAARCPTGQLHLVDGGGHMLIHQLDEIVAGLAPQDS